MNIIAICYVGRTSGVNEKLKFGTWTELKLALGQLSEFVSL